MTTHLPMLLLLASVCCFSGLHAETKRKELRSKEVNQESIIQLGPPLKYNRINPSRVVQLSWRPRVFLYRGFLSEVECDHLITLAEGKKENSLRNGGDLGKAENSELTRNSETSLIMIDDVVARIEERISSWTFLPKENSNPFKFLHFGLEDAKEKYDYLGNKSNAALDEPLMATVVLYLSNVSQGGQILFPDAELLEISHVDKRIWSNCRQSSSMLRPTKGNAILFFNSHLNGSPDRDSRHARCPVVEGEMWCATKFFTVRAVNREKDQKVPLQLEDGDCADEDENCTRWAAVGECQRNPIFMIGSPDYYGTCRKSCNAC